MAERKSRKITSLQPHGTYGAKPTGKPEDAGKRLRALAERRIAIEGIGPEIDGGRFPAKAVVGRPFHIEADIFCDGHEIIDAAIRWRKVGARHWAENAMVFLENDRWTTDLLFENLGAHEFSLIAWRDLFGTWRKDTAKKVEAGQNVALEIEEGHRLIQNALPQGRGAGKADPEIAALAKKLSKSGYAASLDALMADETAAAMKRAAPRINLTHYERILRVDVDRPAAAFSAWYELMPRSQSGDPEKHGTFDDVIAHLPYVRSLGFDVLYFPPIHPIGKTNRKGRNNSLKAGPEDPGSPYAIGSNEGGHDAIHPELGTFDDFKRLVAAAAGHGLEIALDFAIQCSPDHPWIQEHPEWFDWRPDGTIKFAENPPKKYEDIVNVHFYREAIPGLWYALRDVVLFWIEHGVKIFRVDNPHTKPFPFWEWMIEEVRAEHPDVIFLAEAFTRPKVMKRLAKIGFNQSYSYFTWRNEKWELQEYLTELTQEECRYYMRPNFFANTPDINPYYLQNSGRPGFRTRLILAATLGGNYGIYNGFEICEAVAIPGKEEYLNSEKYQIRTWDMEQPGNILDDIRLINRLRQEHPALQEFSSLKFFNAWNDSVLYYGKFDPNTDNYLLFHVNLDAHNIQATDFEVPLWEFDLPDEASIEVQDVIHGNHFTWHGKNHHLVLDPADNPYAIWRLLPPGAAR